MTDRKPDSVLSAEQWKELEKKVFDNAGEALANMHTWALSKAQPPIATVIMSALWGLSSLPAGTTFNAGMGDGSINTLVALVAPPGQGKDSLVGDIARSLKVSHRGREVEISEAGIGTGEGIITRCQPDSDGLPADPVLFGVSEISSMETLMKRQGAILRPTIMSMYSGNALGVSNKHESSYVPRNSYTAGLWVGVQPDKAGALLLGADDGLAHRFIWTELLNPHHVEVDIAPNLHTIVIPEDIDQGFTYPMEVKKQTRAARIEALKYGAPGDHKGHRHQTRLKLAAGLALLRSGRNVDAHDWYRAGVLMDYSDAVRKHCLEHLELTEDKEALEREKRRERVKDRVELDKINKAWNKIIVAVRQHQKVNRSDLYRSARRYRDEFNAAYDQLLSRNIISEIPNGNSAVIVPGPNFPKMAEAVA